MRYLPVFGLGIFFVLAGIGLFAVTVLRAKPAEPAKPTASLKKSEIREREAQKAVQQTESMKLRVAGGVCVALGVTLMFIS